VIGLLLQDWITIQGDSTSPPMNVVQSERDWRSLEPFQDVVSWVEYPSASIPGGQLTLFMETAPTRDEKLFKSMNAGLVLNAPGATPVVVKMLASAATSANPPLARWLRWRLNAVNASTTWTATMRISLALNLAMGAA
jgi:hypothetical protein